MLGNLMIRWEDIRLDQDAELGQGGFGCVLKGEWQVRRSMSVTTSVIKRLSQTRACNAMQEKLSSRDILHDIATHRVTLWQSNYCQWRM
jgi:hypothetical protein